MDKRHPPTAKRLTKVAKEGRVVRSKLLLAAGVILAGIAVVKWQTPSPVTSLLSHVIGLPPTEAVRFAGKAFLHYVLSPLVAISSIAVLLSIAQGLRFKVECKLRFGNPCRGFVKNFLINSFGALLLIVILTMLFYNWIHSPPTDFKSLLEQPLRIIICVAIFIGIADYLFERRSFLSGLYMTQQELLDELKEDEGDPHLRHYRSSIARELAYSEIVARVRRAKVILVERNKL